MKYLLAIFVCLLTVTRRGFSEQALQGKLNIHLGQLHYQDGIFSASQGGYIQGDSFYLQANCLTYTKTSSSESSAHQVHGQKQIALYKDFQLFLGDSCFYDFTLQTGYICNARTSYGLFLIEAKKITLNSDKSYDAYDVTLTTLDHLQLFSLKVQHLRFFAQDTLQATNLRVNIGKVPLFLVPKWKYKLTPSESSPIRYQLSWDAGQGPQVSFRYKVLSLPTFNLFLRGDYRYKRGPAGAIEMNYRSWDGLTTFFSKNYGAYDTFYNDDQPNKKQTRFRFQSALKKTSQDERTGIHLTFDRLTDKNMPQDFKMDRFEFDSQKINQCAIFHAAPSYKAQALFTPRVNGYQGFNQKIPEFNMHLQPIPLLKSHLLLYNQFKLSFYDYVYSNMLIYPENYSEALKDFHSLRAETRQNLTFPLSWKIFKILPTVGFKGIIYTNSPEKTTAYQAIVDYGLKALTHIEKCYSNSKHLITPYLDYQGVYKPAIQPQNVYIFSLDDGYHPLNLLTFGIKQIFSKHSSFLYHTSIDCYGLSFFGDTTYRLTVPKAGLKINTSYDSYQIAAHLRWNFNNRVLDIGNLLIAYTLNSYASCTLELRYRSPFDWRKCDHENYILDVTRPIEELFISPLSDRRFTLIAQAAFNLTPKWTCHLQMHNGWGRKNEPGYTEAKVDLTTLISSVWKVNLSYMFTTRGRSHFGLKIDLNK